MSKQPGEYHENNVGGSLVLFEAMQRAGVRHLVFSSSATVYGDPEALPVTEDMPANRATNPYGKTKSDIEQILADRRHETLVGGSLCCGTLILWALMRVG